MACWDGAIDSGARSVPVDSAPAPGAQQTGDGGRESIPAEWTVFEDTSRAGEVMTASLQLPAAKDIEGLVDDKASRLILRCVNGQVQASIETEAADMGEAGSDSSGVVGQTVRIQLDSAPACE
jgi:hypothetical protein